MASITLIRKNKDNSSSWKIRASLGKDPATGEYKYISQSFKGSKKQADLKAKELQLQIDKGEFKQSSTDTLSNFMQQWLKVKKMEVSLRSYDNYTNIIKYHIEKPLGKTKLDELTPQLIQNYIVNYRPTEISQTTRRNIFKALKLMLKNAVVLELIDKNPMEDLKAPKQALPELNIPDKKDLTKIINYLKEQDRRIWVITGSQIAVATGMRLGEILGLKWSDINFINQTITIQRDVVTTDSGTYIGSTKNKTSKRTIAIGDQLSIILENYKSELSEQMEKFAKRKVVEDDWLFPYFNYYSGEMDTDRTYTPPALSQAWRRAVKSVGLSKIRFHDLRHFHAVNLLSKKISIKQIQNRLGHASSNVTQDIYMRYLPPEMDEEVKRVSDSFVI
jgi:integrase